MEPKKVGSGASTDQGGASGQNKVGGKSDGEQVKDDLSNEPVRFQDHKRVLDSMHHFKTKWQDIKDRNTDLEAQLQSLNDDKLQAEGKKDELIQSLKEQNKDSVSKHNKFRDSWIENEKLRAVEKAATKLGMSDEALEDLDRFDFDGVDVEITDRGRVRVSGASDLVEDWKKNKRYLFKDSKPTRINSGGGRRPPLQVPTDLTADYMVKLEKSDNKKYMSLYPKYLEQVRARQRA